MHVQHVLQGMSAADARVNYTLQLLPGTDGMSHRPSWLYPYVQLAEAQFTQGVGNCHCNSVLC